MRLISYTLLAYTPIVRLFYYDPFTQEDRTLSASLVWTVGPINKAILWTM